MSLDDFSLQSNNGKQKKLNNIPHGVRKDQIDEKLHNVFNVFDINKDGTLENEEVKGLESWVKGLAGIDGDDKKFSEIEGLLGASVFKQQFKLDPNEDVDLFGFVKSVSEAAEEIVSIEETTMGFPAEQGYEPNEKIITTTYKDGTVETIILYPDGELKYKKIRKPIAITEVYYTIGDNEKRFTPAEIENQIKNMYNQLYTNNPPQHREIVGPRITPPTYQEFKKQTLQQLQITKHDFEEKEIYSDRYAKDIDNENIAKNLYKYINENDNALNDTEFLGILEKINTDNIIGVLNKYENALYDKSLIALILGESGNNDEEMRNVLTGDKGIFTTLLAKAKEVGMPEEAIVSYKTAINEELNARLSGITINPDTERLNGLLLGLKNSIELYEKNPKLKDTANSHWHTERTQYEQTQRKATIKYILNQVTAARRQIEAHYEYLKENMFKNLGEIIIEDIRFWAIDMSPFGDEIANGLVNLAESLGFKKGTAEALFESIHDKMNELRALEAKLIRLQNSSNNDETFKQEYKTLLGVEYMPEAMNGLMHLVENAPWKNDPEYIQYLKDLQQYEFNKRIQNGNSTQNPVNDFQELLKPDPNRPKYQINTDTVEYKQYAQQIQDMMLAIVGEDYVKNIQDYVGTSGTLGGVVEMALFIYATMGTGAYAAGASWTTRAAAGAKSFAAYSAARGALNFTDDILKISGVSDKIGWTDTSSFEDILGDRQNLTFGGAIIGEKNYDNFKTALTIIKNWSDGNLSTEAAKEAFKAIDGFSFDDFVTSTGGQLVINTATSAIFGATMGAAAPHIAKVGEWGARLGEKMGMKAPELTKVGLEILSKHPKGLNGAEFLTQVALKMQTQNAAAISAKFIAETALFFTTNLSVSMVQEALSESNTELEDAWAKGPEEFAKYLAARFGQEAINLLEVKSIGMIIAMMMGMNQQAVIRDNYSQYETMKNVTIKIEDVATANNYNSNSSGSSNLPSLTNIPEGKCITITGPTGKLIVDGNISQFIDTNGKLLNKTNIGNNGYQNADAVTKTIFLLHTYMGFEAKFAPANPTNPVQDAEIIRPLELSVKPEVTLPQTINPLNSNAGNTSATRAFTPKAIEVTSLYNKNIRSEYYNQNKKYPLYTTRGIDVEFSAESGAQRLRRVTFPKNEPVILVSQIGTNAGTTTLDKTLFTYEMIECAALAVVDKANNRQTLIHVNPGQSIEANRAIIEHILSGSNPKDVEFSIVHGDSERTFSTIQFILDTIGEVAPESNVKLYNFDTFGKFGGVLLKNGELTCCDVNTPAIHNGTYTNIQNNPTANITRAIETTAKPLKEFNPQEEATKLRSIVTNSTNPIRTNENVEQYITDIVKLAQNNPQIPSEDIYNLVNNWQLEMRIRDGKYDFNDFENVINLTAKYPEYQHDLIKLMSKEKYSLENLQEALNDSKFKQLADTLGVEYALNYKEADLLEVGKEKFDTINEILHGEKPVELTQYEQTLLNETGINIKFDYNISIEKAQQYVEIIKKVKAQYDKASENYAKEIFVTTNMRSDTYGIVAPSQHPNTICIRPVENLADFEHSICHESVHLSDMNYKSNETKSSPIGTKTALVNGKVTKVYDQTLGNKITRLASRLISRYSVADTNEFLAEIGAMILEGKITIKQYEAGNTVISQKIEYKEPFINIDGKEIEITPDVREALNEIMDYYFKLGGKTYAETQTGEVTFDSFNAKLNELDIQTETIQLKNGNTLVKFKTYDNKSDTKFDYAEFDTTGKLIKIKNEVENSDFTKIFSNKSPYQAPTTEITSLEMETELCAQTGQELKYSKTDYAKFRYQLAKEQHRYILNDIETELIKRVLSNPELNKNESVLTSLKRAFAYGSYKIEKLRDAAILYNALCNKQLMADADKQWGVGNMMGNFAGMNISLLKGFANDYDSYKKLPDGTGELNPNSELSKALNAVKEEHGTKILDKVIHSDLINNTNVQYHLAEIIASLKNSDAYLSKHMIIDTYLKNTEYGYDKQIVKNLGNLILNYDFETHGDPNVYLIEESKKLTSFDINKDAEKRLFQGVLSNNSKIENYIANLDFKKYEYHEPTLNYTRENFNADITFAIAGLQESDRQLILTHFGLKEKNGEFVGIMNNTEFNNPYLPQEVQEAANGVRDAINNFTISNRTTSLAPEETDFIEPLLQGFPEIGSWLGRKYQDGMTAESQIFLALQETITQKEISLSDEGKTIAKIGTLIYWTQADVNKVLERMTLGNATKEKIKNIVKNLNILTDYTAGKVEANDVTSRFRTVEEYKIANVIMNTVDTYKNTLTPELDKAVMQSYSTSYQNRNYLFTSHIVTRDKVPTKTRTINYHDYTVPVIDLPSIPAGTDMGEYGFPKGTKKEDLIFNVHGLSNHGNNIEQYNFEKLMELINNGSDFALSSILMKEGNVTPAYGMVGVVLRTANKNIMTTHIDGATGQKRNINYLKSGYVYTPTCRINLTKHLNELGVELTPQEYIYLALEIENKQFTPGQHDITLKSGKVIEAKTLETALNKTMEEIFDHEITEYSPQIEALYVKANSFEECPDWVVKVSDIYGLDIIIQKPNTPIDVHSNNATTGTTINISNQQPSTDFSQLTLEQQAEAIILAERPAHANRYSTLFKSNTPTVTNPDGTRIATIENMGNGLTLKQYQASNGDINGFEMLAEINGTKFTVMTDKDGKHLYNTITEAPELLEKYPQEKYNQLFHLVCEKYYGRTNAELPSEEEFINIYISEIIRTHQNSMAKANEPYNFKMNNIIKHYIECQQRAGIETTPILNTLSEIEKFFTETSRQIRTNNQYTHMELINGNEKIPSEEAFIAKTMTNLLNATTELELLTLLDDIQSYKKAIGATAKEYNDIVEAINLKIKKLKNETQTSSSPISPKEQLKIKNKIIRELERVEKIFITMFPEDFWTKFDYENASTHLKHMLELAKYDYNNGFEYVCKNGYFYSKKGADTFEQLKTRYPIVAREFNVRTDFDLLSSHLTVEDYHKAEERGLFEIPAIKGAWNIKEAVNIPEDIFYANIESIQKGIIYFSERPEINELFKTLADKGVNEKDNLEDLDNKLQEIANESPEIYESILTRLAQLTTKIAIQCFEEHTALKREVVVKTSDGRGWTTYKLDYDTYFKYADAIAQKSETTYQFETNLKHIQQLYEIENILRQKDPNYSWEIQGTEKVEKLKANAIKSPERYVNDSNLESATAQNAIMSFLLFKDVDTEIINLQKALAKCEESMEDEYDGNFLDTEEAKLIINFYQTNDAKIKELTKNNDKVGLENLINEFFGSKTANEALAEITEFFEQNKIGLIRLSTILDKETLDVLMRKRLNDVEEYLSTVKHFKTEELILLKELTESLSPDGKPFMPAIKLEFIELINAYKSCNLSFDNIKTMLANGNVDITKLHKDLFIEVMKQCGISEAEIVNTPLERLIGWDLRYIHHLANNMRKQDCKDNLSVIIRETNAGTFKKYLLAHDNIHGQANRKTVLAFMKNNMSPENWANTPKELEVKYKFVDENHNQLISLATQLVEDINMLRFEEKIDPETGETKLVNRPSKGAIEQILKALAPDILTKDGDIAIPTKYTNDKESLTQFITTILEHPKLKEMEARATANANNPARATSATLTLTAINHIKTKLESIATLKSGKAKKAYDLTIGMWERNPQVDLFQGDYSTCCIGQGANSNEAAMNNFVLNLAYNMITITDNTTGKIIGNALCYYVLDNSGKKSFIIDNIEINNAHKPSDEIGLELRNKIVEYAINLNKAVTGDENTPIYMSAKYNDVPCNDLNPTTKRVSFLGNLSCENIYMDLYNGWVNTSQLNQQLKLLKLN